MSDELTQATAGTHISTSSGEPSTRSVGDEPNSHAVSATAYPSSPAAVRRGPRCRA